MNFFNYFLLSSIVFSVGFLGIFINRKNIISILMSIEIMLLAANINFVGFSNVLDDLYGLAILIIFFNKSGTISVDFINKLKG